MKTKSLSCLFLFIILCFFNAHANDGQDNIKKIVEISQASKREYLDRFILVINKEFDFQQVRAFDKKSIKEQFEIFLAKEGYNSFFSSNFLDYVDLSSLKEEVQGFSMRGGIRKDVACDVKLDLAKANSDFYGQLKCDSRDLNIGLKEKAVKSDNEQYEVVHMDAESGSLVR